jgi:MraZ protein
MLRGRFEHNLDNKGRVSIPSRLRETLVENYSEVLVVTNFDHCLVAYPLEEWEALERKVASWPQMKKEVKAFHRFFISGAVECPMDKQGRILIPSTLREWAGIEREVILVGVLKKIEIWAKGRWEEEFVKASKSFDKISEVLGDLGL